MAGAGAGTQALQLPGVRYPSLETKGGSNFSRVLRSVTQKHTASLSQGTERTKAAFDLFWLCTFAFFFFPTNLNLTFMKIKLIILHLCSQRKFDLNVTHKVVAQKGAVCQMDSSVC